MDKIYKLKFGEEYYDEKTQYSIIRVPGGWIFYTGNNNGKCTTFVPFSTEFQNK